MKIEKIIRGILILVLLSLAIPIASASIEITDIGEGYDLIGHYGFVDYQNIANYNISGAILVFIDGDIVAGKILDMPIRYVAGFRCGPIKTLEFPLRTTKGDHTIVAYAVSMNRTVHCMFNYSMEGWEEMEAEEGTEVKEEDWMKCP
jgi:hypothetical protein